MGLCKCPKRVVTNQFCYEHKVNVCESCMVTNHPTCVVLSYLKWLQDGDYNPVCELCSKNLNDDECIRLVCYHVFHWPCLNNYAKQLPATIAPAGYTCPCCSSPMFPSSNLVSPVADVLRKKFETVNWARIGLGLPLLSEEEVIKRRISVEQAPFQNNLLCDIRKEQKSSDTVVHIEEQYGKVDNIFEKKYPDNVPRRLTHVSENKRLLPSRFDDDDNKYERRSGPDKFHTYARRSRYFHFFLKNKYRQYFTISAGLFIGFFLFMLVLQKLGGSIPEADDPLFNLHLNPNIHVKDDDS